MAPHNLQSPSSDSMATTMTLTDPEKAAHATSPKPGTPERQVDPARASGEFEDPVKAEKLADDAGSDDDINYPTGLPLAFITIGLCLAVFLVALDQTIIATAIPRITDQFKSLDDVGWYGSAYMLTLCSFQLIYGRIYTFFSLKWCFLATIFLFELGSLVSGVSTSSEALIVGRAIQGLGASGIFSGALIILAHSVPLRKRPIYTGVIVGMWGIASVAGPLMGGVFTDHITWRWCFYINLPIGAFTVVAIMIFFKPPNRKMDETLTAKDKLAKFDIIGTLLLLPAVVCLLLALQWGGSLYPWKSARIIALFCLFGILIIAFTYVQLTSGENATLPMRILKQRTIAFGAAVSFSIGCGFLLMVFFVPLWFQAIQGVSATESGIRNLPLVLAVTLFSIIAGGAITGFGYYAPLGIVGSVIYAIGCGLIASFEVDTGIGKWISYQVIAGAGVGLMMQIPLIAAQTVLTIEDVPTGTAIMVFVQSLGGALFISVGQNLFSNSLIKGLEATNIPGIDPHAVINMGATSLKNMFNSDQLPLVLSAYNGALVKTYYAAMAMAIFGFFASFGVEWVSVKGKKIEVAPGA